MKKNILAILLLRSMDDYLYRKIYKIVYKGVLQQLKTYNDNKWIREWNKLYNENPNYAECY